MLKIPAPRKTTHLAHSVMLTSAENFRAIKHEYGWDAYITKSVDATAVIAAVQEHLL
jgi:hypothetical protein